MPSRAEATTTARNQILPRLTLTQISLQSHPVKTQFWAFSPHPLPCEKSHFLERNELRNPILMFDCGQFITVNTVRFGDFATEGKLGREGREGKE
jgi:hypothetical protein